MTNTNTQTATDDQALVNDLFADLAADELDFDGLDIGIEAVEAATPAVEAEIDIDSIEAELEAPIEAATPTVEAVVEEVEPLAVEAAVEEVAPTTEVDNLLSDLGLDGLDLGGLDLEVEAAATPVASAPKKAKKKSLAPKLDDGEEENQKPKPKASSGTTSNRVTYYNSSNSTVLLDRLGGNKDLIILEASDMQLPSEELQAKRQYLLSVLNNQPTGASADSGETLQKKVAARVVQLFTYLNNGGQLNRYTYIAFEVLFADGYLSTKKNGNLYNAYIANGYDKSTASPHVGQMSQLFPFLKIGIKDGDQIVPNEDSIILAKMRAEMNIQEAA